MSVGLPAEVGPRPTLNTVEGRGATKEGADAEGSFPTMGGLEDGEPEGT